MNVGVGEINANRTVTFRNLRPYTVYTFCVWRGENVEQDPVRTHYFVPQAGIKKKTANKNIVDCFDF